MLVKEGATTLAAIFRSLFGIFSSLVALPIYSFKWFDFFLNIDPLKRRYSVSRINIGKWANFRTRNFLCWTLACVCKMIVKCFCQSAISPGEVESWFPVLTWDTLVDLLCRDCSSLINHQVLRGSLLFASRFSEKYLRLAFFTELLALFLASLNCFQIKGSFVDATFLFLFYFLFYVVQATVHE